MLATSLRWSRRLFFCAVASVALYGNSCSSTGDTGTGGSGGSSPLADVVYEGDANDEALAALLAADPVTNPPRRAVFDTPIDGADLPAATIPTFSWHVESDGGEGGAGGKDGGARAPVPAPSSRWALVDLLPGLRAPRQAHPGLGPLLDLFGAERAASAHGDRLYGEAYLLVLSIPSDDKLLRVFTTNTTYTPDAAAWAKLEGAGATINAWILTGFFEANAVAAGVGPFRGPWIGFSVVP